MLEACGEPRWGTVTRLLRQGMHVTCEANWFPTVVAPLLTAKKIKWLKKLASHPDTALVSRLNILRLTLARENLAPEGTELVHQLSNQQQAFLLEWLASNEVALDWLEPVKRSWVEVKRFEKEIGGSHDWIVTRLRFETLIPDVLADGPMRQRVSASAMELIGITPAMIVELSQDRAAGRSIQGLPLSLYLAIVEGGLVCSDPTGQACLFWLADQLELLDAEEPALSGDAAKVSKQWWEDWGAMRIRASLEVEFDRDADAVRSRAEFVQRLLLWLHALPEEERQRAASHFLLSRPFSYGETSRVLADESDVVVALTLGPGSPWGTALLAKDISKYFGWDIQIGLMGDALVIKTKDAEYHAYRCQTFEIADPVSGASTSTFHNLSQDQLLGMAVLESASKAMHDENQLKVPRMLAYVSRLGIGISDPAILRQLQESGWLNSPSDPEAAGLLLGAMIREHRITAKEPYAVDLLARWKPSPKESSTSCPAGMFWPFWEAVSAERRPDGQL